MLGKDVNSYPKYAWELKNNVSKELKESIKEQNNNINGEVKIFKRPRQTF